MIDDLDKIDLEASGRPATAFELGATLQYVSILSSSVRNVAGILRAASKESGSKAVLGDIIATLDKLEEQSDFLSRELLGINAKESGK